MLISKTRSASLTEALQSKTVTVPCHSTMLCLMSHGGEIIGCEGSLRVNKMHRSEISFIL